MYVHGELSGRAEVASTSTQQAPRSTTQRFAYLCTWWRFSSSRSSQQQHPASTQQKHASGGRGVHVGRHQMETKWLAAGATKSSEARLAGSGFRVQSAPSD